MVKRTCRWKWRYAPDTHIDAFVYVFNVIYSIDLRIWIRTEKSIYVMFSFKLKNAIYKIKLHIHWWQAGVFYTRIVSNFFVYTPKVRFAYNPFLVNSRDYIAIKYSLTKNQTQGLEQNILLIDRGLLAYRGYESVYNRISKYFAYYKFVTRRLLRLLVMVLPSWFLLITKPYWGYEVLLIL